MSVWCQVTTLPVFRNYYGDQAVFNEYDEMLKASRSSSQGGGEVELNWSEFLSAFGPATRQLDLERDCLDAIAAEFEQPSHETILIDVNRAFRPKGK